MTIKMIKKNKKYLYPKDNIDNEHSQKTMLRLNVIQNLTLEI